MTLTLAISPGALARKVDMDLADNGGEPAPILLVRADPAWPHPPTLSLSGGRVATVVGCPSALAVWEQVTTHRADHPLVLLTDVAESALGDGVLSRVHRQRLSQVDRWDLVLTCFGAQRLDTRLREAIWAPEALLDAMPTTGWPPLTGGVLSRDYALRHLAAERLGLSELDIPPDALDAAVLLRWSAQPGAADRLAALRDAEREGLIGWLTEIGSRPAAAFFAAVAAGRTADALALGVICDAAWAPEAGEGTRAQGAVSADLGATRFDDATMRAFGDTARTVVLEMLADADTRAGQRVLDRADGLIGQLNARDAADHSDLLRAGLEHRVAKVAEHLTDCLRGPGGTGRSGGTRRMAATERLAAATERLGRHHLAAHQHHRVERTRMALRLTRWLESEVTAPLSVADGIQRHIEEWGWVDRAYHEVWEGEDADPRLKAAYRELCQRVEERRRTVDRAFAERLAAWTEAGTAAGALLTVESLLERVVAPAVRRAAVAPLLLVLDGMSAAVACDLADRLDRDGWVEYDPTGSADDPRRRGAVAALPTLTAVSRTSLLSSRLRTGDRHDEKRDFEQSGLWRRRQGRVFHKAGITGGAGELIDPGLDTSLSDPDTVVAVVINTVDDALGPGREGTGAGWPIDSIGPLRPLLDQALYNGRPVIITSDHGHILERGGVLRSATDRCSARHRAGTDPAGDGEVLLTGSRVVADNQRIVALWDSGVRYLQRRAGYHGGASIAEVTVPVLAYLPPGATPPDGWVPVDQRRPAWWRTDIQSGTPITATPAVSADSTTPATVRRAGPATRRPREPVGDTLFEVATASRTPDEPSEVGPARAELLVAALLDSDLFAAQLARVPRRVSRQKVGRAIAALLDAGGPLPLPVVAQQADEQVARSAIGFATVLQGILNVDNYPVLSIVDGGRAARLDEALLRTQFDLPEAGR